MLALFDRPSTDKAQVLQPLHFLPRLLPELCSPRSDGQFDVSAQVWSSFMRARDLFGAFDDKLLVLYLRNMEAAESYLSILDWDTHVRNHTEQHLRAEVVATIASWAED